MPGFLLTACLMIAAGGPDNGLSAADTLLRQGRYEQAAAQFQAIAEKNPGSAQAWFGLAVSYSQMQRPGAVIDAIRKYLKLVPDAADGRAILGLALEATGRLPEARTELERAVRLDSSQTEAVEALAHVHLLLGDPARSVALLRPLARGPELSPAGRVLLSSALARSGDYAAAFDTLQPLVDRAAPPAPVEAFVIGTTALRKLARGREALMLCERGMRAYPNAIRLEQVYLDEAMPVLVTRIKERLKAVPPGAAGLPEMIQLGRNIVDSDSGRTAPLGAAENLLSQAVRFAPANAGAWYHYGRCLFALGRLEDARAAVEKGLAVAADGEMRTLLYTEMGIVETNLSHFDRAEQAFRSAMEADRRLPAFVPEPAFEYFRFLSLQGRTRDAQAAIEEILRRQPYYLPARLENAKQLAEEDKLERAIEEGEFVIRNTEDPRLLRPAHLLLAKTCHRAGRAADAERHQAWIRNAGNARQAP